MADKTKAALQGRHHHYQKLKQSQDTRFNAGGQSLSKMHICILGIVSVSFSKALKSALGFSSNRERHAVPCSVGQKITELNFEEADFIQFFNRLNFAPADYIQFFSSSLAFLRWRRLISPLIEATTKPAILSPCSFTFSSSPINSNGTLETICCDLLFLEPVAMSVFPSDWWHSVYAKRKHNQYLKVAFTLFYGKCMPPVMVKHKWQRPGVLGTTAEASNQKRYQR